MPARPAIVVADDDGDFLRSVERDLRRKYEDRFDVITASNGEEALRLLDQRQRAGEPVAALLVDGDLSDITTTEILDQAQKVAPNAKRILLTTNTEGDAAVDAVRRDSIDHFLAKPCEPAEDNLYPYLTDLLEAWYLEHPPSAQHLRVIGSRWSRHSYLLRDFLGRNAISFRWLDVERSREGREALDRLRHEGKEHTLPVVLLPTGEALAKPDPADLAERIGLRIHAEQRYYDLVVIGAGPAGLAAAVYGASEGLHTLVIEREAPGGQAGTSSNIENYLGFPAGLTGADLTRRAVAQARKFGAEILTPQTASAVHCREGYCTVSLGDDSEVSARTVLIATGVSWRTLDVPNAERLTGRGIYYGASRTEAVSCSNEEVFVVGGGNSAGQAAAHFSQYARQVTMLVMESGLDEKMSQYLVDDISASENIRVLTDTRVLSVEGEERLQAITIESNGERQTLQASSLFVFIGGEPRTEWLERTVARDDQGYIFTGPDIPEGLWPLERAPFLLETSVPGIFCAGDVRHDSVKRVASAIGDGSIAVQFVHRYLAE